MRALVAAIALGACTPPPKPAPLEGRTTEPPRPAPTTPAPSVTWIDNGFDTPRLPAVTDDGSRVIVGEIAEDGGRGNPNLRIVARDRNDAIVEAITILKVDEVDAMFDTEGRHPKLDARMSAANAWLDRLHRSSDLVELPKLEVDSADMYTQHAASAGAVMLDWQRDRLTITRDKKAVLTRDTPATWHAPVQGGCSNPAKLGAAWVDLDRKLALVEIIYNGTDMCWEPSPQQHVISW